jgi:DNA-directed RNA polymerase subunit beta'
MKSVDEIIELEKKLKKLENLHASFDYLRVTIASPERIKNWANRTLPSGEIIGELRNPETINFRTYVPEAYGLFCQIIFGPTKNWNCACGKYTGFNFDQVCELCHVELTEARVRRYRMGYINLNCPITHFWYLKGIPSYLCLLLRTLDDTIRVHHIEHVVYFREGDLGITDPDHPFYSFLLQNKEDTQNEFDKFCELLSDYPSALAEKRRWFSSPWPKYRRGTEIIKAALESIDMEQIIKNSRLAIIRDSFRNLTSSYIPQKSLIKQIRILESFVSTKTNPTWMILTVLPILPPHLRPLLELESGRLVAADINEIYRLVAIRNRRLFEFLFLDVAPDIINFHARKLLQEGVDALIDNARVKDKNFRINDRILKSLTETLEGKQGRFRQSLLGKRVDYSGRSVIIVGPNLRLNQCGLPYEMATELFQPFLIHELLKTKIHSPSNNTKLARLIIKKNKPFVWSLLKELTKKYAILLNRAPTLHRFGIQAFDPIIILGQAIHLHPLVCTGFNADFDGDQMAIHLPLYETSQLEARTLMRPSYHVLSPSNGDVILKPTQDMVIGCYYLTLMIKNNSSKLKKWFKNQDEVLTAFYQKKIAIHTPILVCSSPDNFKISVENGKFYFFENSNINNRNQKEIFLLKKFQIGNSPLKYYFITTIGIFIARYLNQTQYLLTDFFLETTAGRIIFNINFTNSIKR